MTRIQRGWAVAAVLAGALFACTIALFLGGTMPLAPAAPWTAPRISKESPRAFTALKTCSTCVSVPPAF